MDKRTFFAGFGAGLACAAALMLAVDGMATEGGKPAAESQPAVSASQADERTVAETTPAAPAPAKPPAPPRQTSSAPVEAPKPPQIANTAGTAPVKGITAPAGTSPAASPAVPEKTQWVAFGVQPGETSSEVANRLVKAGVLTSAEPFLSMLRQQDKLDRIRVGTYQLAKGSDPADIIRLLTTPPRQ